MRVRAVGHARRTHSQQFTQTTAAQLTGVQFFDDGAALEYHDAVSDIEHQVQILFNNDQGQTEFIAQAGQGRANLLHDRRLYAFAGFIQQQQPRLRNQCACQGQNLLLAAGQGAALAVQQHTQTRELIDHTLDRLLFGFANVFAPGHAQVFQSSEARQNATALWYVAYAHLRALVSGRTRGFCAVEFNTPACGRHQAHDDFKQRGFAHAVVADDADRFAFVDLQIHAMQNGYASITGAQIGHLKNDISAFKTIGHRIV